MSEDFKKKDGDQRTDSGQGNNHESRSESNRENSPENRPETKAAREVGSIDSTIMNLIAKKRTNSSSGSLDESQDHSLEIDFGGSIESRKNRLHSELLAQAKEPTAFKPMPMPLPPVELHRPSDAMAPIADLAAPSDLINNRTELKRLVAEKIHSPSEQKQFLDDIEHFEGNFEQRSCKNATAKLREMADTYAQLSRLLSADTDALAKYPQCQLKEGETPWRVRVAEQVIHQAAEPFTISQGTLAVCAAAALEVREYYREPAAVARLVTDVLLTGSYEATAGGTKVDLTKCPDNLIPDLFAMQFTVENEVHGVPAHAWGNTYAGARSFASQLFEVTAINLALQPRGFRYEQPNPKAYKEKQNDANGTTVNIETLEAKPWGSGEGRGFTEIDIVSSAYHISGRDETGFVIAAGKLTRSEASNFELRKMYDFANRDTGTTNIFSKEELVESLRRTKEVGQWPPIIRLDASMPPLSLKDAGAHFLVITSMTADGKSLAFDNTWEEAKDRNEGPSTPTSIIAASMFSFKIASRSEASNLVPRVNYFLQHPGQQDTLIKRWLEIPDKLKTAGTNLTPAEYERLNPDPDLHLWINIHPEDKDLSLWKTRIQEWLTRYQTKQQ